jgi:GntR family transcriptional regulator
MIAVPRPLYAQVREALVRRIADGEWPAGTALPSEFALAAELGVSQGTVRKALDAMAAENLVDRRQGRGTFVPEHTEARALFHFFRIQNQAGAPVVPRTLDQRLEPGGPRPPLAGETWRIERVRALDGRPAIVEHIHIERDRFPRLSADTSLPNALYPWYQKAGGVSVARAEDRLSAAAAAEPIAAALGLAAGAPLLLARRVAYDLMDRPVELRESWIETSGHAYAVSLR